MTTRRDWKSLWEADVAVKGYLNKNLKAVHVNTAWPRTREGSTSFCLCLSLESEQAAVALRRDGRTDVAANHTTLGIVQLKIKR